jgi:hypothetical protein
MLGQVFREEARIQVIDIAGFGADNDTDGFALVKGGLSEENGAPRQSEQ